MSPLKFSCLSESKSRKFIYCDYLIGVLNLIYGLFLSLSYHLLTLKKMGHLFESPFFKVMRKLTLHIIAQLHYFSMQIWQSQKKHWYKHEITFKSFHVVGEGGSFCPEGTSHSGEKVGSLGLSLFLLWIWHKLGTQWGSSVPFYFPLLISNWFLNFKFCFKLCKLFAWFESQISETKSSRRPVPHRYPFPLNFMVWLSFICSLLMEADVHMYPDCLSLKIAHYSHFPCLAFFFLTIYPGCHPIIVSRQSYSLFFYKAAC